MNLKNKTVLITGGAKGIGLATAKRILEQGSMVILWDFDRESLNETMQRVNQFTKTDIGNTIRISKKSDFKFSGTQSKQLRVVIID